MSNILGKSVVGQANDIIKKSESIANPLTNMITELQKSNNSIEQSLAAIAENQAILARSEQDLLAAKATNLSLLESLSNIFKTKE